MNDTKKDTESFNEVKIIKPKAVRLCPTRKIKKSPSSSSTSSSNSVKSQNQNNSDDTKNMLIDLEKISIEEINNDFFNFGESLEEELCHNEILDILNNDKDVDNENIHKIKRCKNPYENNIELMKDSYFNNIQIDINDLNDLN
jgi:hypothetical protein